MNIADIVRDSASKHPDKAALIFQDGSITYAELDAAIDRAAAGITSLGIRKGDRVGVMVHNIPQFVETYLGVARAGGVSVPLNVMYTVEEVAYILSDAEARAAVVAEPFTRSVAGLLQTLPMLEHVVVVGDRAPMGTMTFDQMLGRGDVAPAVDAGDEDLAALVYTSGTTGRPKGAMLTHRNLMANLDQISDVPLLAEAEQDVVLVALPLFHIYALNAVLGLTLRSGATAVLQERFDPVSSLDAVERHGITVLPGAPPMFIAWLSMADIEKRDLTSVRIAISGASALPGPVLEEFARRLGITIWEGYGLTESAPVLTSTAVGDSPKPGSIGKPLPGVEVRLVGEDGNDVEEGDPGEIAVRGANVFRGYWRQPEDTARALRDGWLFTGDVAYADEDGYLHIVDRKKDLIIVSGFNVYPREVEDVLHRHPKIADCAVIGVAHPYTGEAIKAVVMLRPGERATEEEIIEHCRRSLARFKCPQVVEFVTELPHTMTGKVLRRALREEKPAND
jgi:long-chain acyl-CoA synthetase